MMTADLLLRMKKLALSDDARQASVEAIPVSAGVDEKNISELQKLFEQAKQGDEAAQAGILQAFEQTDPRSVDHKFQLAVRNYAVSANPQTEFSDNLCKFFRMSESHRMAASGNLAGVKKSISGGELTGLQPDQLGLVPLYDAFRCSHPDIVEHYAGLSSPVKPDSIYDTAIRSGSLLKVSLLHLLGLYGDIETLRKIDLKKVDLLCCHNEDGNWPLFYAFPFGNLEVMPLLFDKRMLETRLQKAGLPVSHVVCSSTFQTSPFALVLIKSLKTLGFNFCQLDKDGHTILYNLFYGRNIFVSIERTCEIVDCLIEHAGVEIGQDAFFGKEIMTVLHFLIRGYYFSPYLEQDDSLFRYISHLVSKAKPQDYKPDSQGRNVAQLLHFFQQSSSRPSPISEEAFEKMRRHCTEERNSRMARIFQGAKQGNQEDQGLLCQVINRAWKLNDVSIRTSESRTFTDWYSNSEIPDTTDPWWLDIRNYAVDNAEEDNKFTHELRRLMGITETHLDAATENLEAERKKQVEIAAAKKTNATITFSPAATQAVSGNVARVVTDSNSATAATSVVSTEKDKSKEKTLDV